MTYEKDCIFRLSWTAKIFNFKSPYPCRLTESFGNSMIARLGFDRENRRHSEQEHVSAVLASRIS